MMIRLRLLFVVVLCALAGVVIPSISWSQCTADAGADVTICQGQSTQIGGNPTAVNAGGGVQYAWTNGASATSNPSVSPNSTTIYTVTLTQGGCAGETDQVVVTVLPSPNAIFTFAPNNPCAGIPVNFTNTTTGCTGCQYSWDFDNPTSGTNNTSTSANPSHTFLSTGGGNETFTVSLTVTSSNGCTDTQTYDIIVKQSPDAILTEDANFTQCLGVGDFYSLVTNASTPASNANYTINWGDATPNYSSATPPSSLEHIYNGINIWTLTYTVTGNNGCTDVQTNEVSNISNPSIGAANPGNTLQCGPVQLCFPLNTYSNNHISTIYNVDFGDGSPVQTFNHPPPTSVCHTYSTSTCANSPQFFTFSITADNNCTPSNATISPIQIFMPPVANFTAPPAACVNSAVPFTNTSIPGYNQGCSTNTSYSWNFGDPASGGNNTSTLASPTHTYAAPGTYTVTVTATNAGNPLLACGTTTFTQNICIEQPPTPTFTVNSNLGCFPMAVNTSNTTLNNFASCNTTSTWIVDYVDLPCDPDNGAYSYTGGTSASSLSPSFLLSSVGTYTLRLQMTNSCGVFQDTEVITVNTVPVVAINTLPTVCAGTTVSPTAAVDACNLPILSYAWTFGSGIPGASSSLNPGVVAYANAGTFPITFTATNACGPSTANTTVSVLAIPDVQITSTATNNTMCNNTTITLNATGAGTYTWSPTTGLSSGSGASVTASPNATITYTVTGTSGSCTDQSTITITVLPNPTLAAAGTYQMCVGQTEQMGVTASGGTGPYNSYTWSPGATLNNPNIQNPISSAIVSTNYNVSVTDFNGCVGTGVVPLTVDPLPIVNAGPDISLCNQPVSTQLSGFSPTAGGTGTWTGTGVTPAGSFTPSVLGPVTLTYCFTSASTGCTACDNMVITVVSPTPANAGPDTTACLGGTPIQLPAGGTWSGSPQVNAAGLFTPTVAGPVTLTYTVGNGSCLTTDQLVVTVLNPPVANAGPDQVVCAGSLVQLSGSGTSSNGAITLYTWTGGVVSNGLIPNPTTTPAATTIYNLTVVDAAGCSDPDQVTITVNPLPAVNAGLDIQVCNQPIATQLTGFTPAAGGVWTGTGVTPSGSFTPTGVGPVTLTYTYTNPATQCTNSDQIVVTVINATVANAGPDISLCLNAPVYQIVPPVAGGTWSPAPVTATGSFTPNTAGTYVLTYTIGSGSCLTTDQMVLTVYSLPVADAGPNLVMCVGESVTLQGSASGGLGGYNYSWNFPATLSNPNIANPIATPALSTTYQLTVTDAHQCVATDQVLVTVNTLPVVEAGNDITVCDQQIAEVLTGFSPTAGGIGTWTGTGISNANGQFTSPGVGTYWVYYNFTAGGNSCGNTDSIQVTVIPPVVANAGPDVSMCLNEGLYQLTGFTPANGGTWSGTGVYDAGTGVFNPASQASGDYTLTLNNGTGTCFTSDQTVVTVLPLPVVTVGSSQTVCGNVVPFNIAGFVPATGGTWEGVGITNPSSGTFDATVAGTGAHNLFYWYESALNGCSDTAFVTITVSPVPVANFTLAPLGCTNAPVDVTNTSVGASTYNWNYGNTATAVGFDPVYTYLAEGIFDVTLIVANAFGCQDTAMNAHEIINPPQASLTLSPASGCAPLDVDFQNNSVGQYLTYSWNLAPATSSSQTPPSQTYQQGPDVVTYPISLTATNFCGSNTDNDIVTVYPQPVAGFGTDLDVFCSPFAVNINNTSTGNPDTFIWDFGDGGAQSFVEEPGNHVFFADTIPVDYTIYLYLSNECGLDTANYTITVLPNTVTSFFNTNVIEGCSPLQVEFTDFSDGGNQVSYNLGDQTFTGNDNPVHTYPIAGEYTVYQYVDNGCSYDTSSMVITVYPSPVMDFSMDAPNICENNTVQFTSVPGTAIDISWDFGDGGISYLSDPSYTYLQGGNYVVTMTGTSDNLCTSSVTHPFTVYNAPDASFTVPDQVGCSPFDVCFSNGTGGGLFYTWDFGDGNTANTNNGCNTYNNVGATPQLYTVSLIAQNLQLCADTFYLDVIVSPQPTSAFILSAFESCYFPIEVSATNVSLDANGYEWMINNNVVSDLNNEVFTFDAVDSYDIVLTASNQFGCTSTSEATYEVHPLPEMAFEVDPADGCVNLLANFTNTTAGALSYQWSFGDGGTSNAINPVYNYTIPGTYDVSLIATTDQGCADTLTYAALIHAYNLPIANFTFDPQETDIYTPTFTFYDNSFDANFWEWDFGDGSTSELENIQHTYEEAGIWPVTLTVWNGYGCKSVANFAVNIQDIFNIYVPNTFTPDHDGINEVFLPLMSGERFIESYLFQIIDRWGTTIFETNDPHMAWTGDVRDGEYFAKDEVYNWQVIVQLKGYDDNRVYFGHVVLVR